MKEELLLCLLNLSESSCDLLLLTTLQELKPD